MIEALLRGMQGYVRVGWISDLTRRVLEAVLRSWVMRRWRRNNFALTVAAWM